MFIERAFPTLLVPSRDLGGMVHGELANGFFTYQIGGFNGVRDGGSQDIDTDDGKDVVGRVFVHPFRPLGNQWLDGFGIGAAGAGAGSTSSRRRVQNDRRVRELLRLPRCRHRRPRRCSPRSRVRENGSGFRRRPTGTPVRSECSASTSSPSRTSTAISCGRDRAANEELRHTAWQVAASVALTGENASYKGLIPASPFDPFKGTWGAFELAARYNEIDFDSDRSRLRESRRLGRSRPGLDRRAQLVPEPLRPRDGRTSTTPGSTAARRRQDRASEDTILTRLQLSY
jgi:phosphate-selective porin OprO/OprP